MKKCFFAFLVLFQLSTVHAFVVISNTTQIKANSPTRLILVGMPDKLGNLFFESALTKARTYLMINPEDQIIILGTSSDNEYAQKAKGFFLFEKNNLILGEESIKNYVRTLTLIESVDIYAHSNAVDGVILDKKQSGSTILYEGNSVWDLARSKTAYNSFVMIHGCNAGVKMAPNLARRLGVPVFGAMTSSDFQNVYNDQIWAFDFDNKNLTLNSNDKRLRMRPLNTVYKGHWGDWTEGGFPTYKLFCTGISEKKCAAGGFEAIRSFPSVMEASAEISLENYRKILIDFMCPVSTYRDTFNECQKNLLNLTPDNVHYSPYRGKTLNCTRERCEAHFQCSRTTMSIDPSLCKLINENPNPSTSFVDDFEFLLNAFDLRNQ